MHLPSSELPVPTELPPDAQPLSSADITAALAFELAAELEAPSEVFRRFNLSDAQAQQLLTNPTFRNLVVEAKREWAQLTNTEKRVRMKALMSVELLLPDMHGMALSAAVNPSARTDIFRALTRLAGLETKEASVPNMERFAITINLGPDNKTVTIDAQPAKDEAA